MQNLKLFSILCAFIAMAMIGCSKGNTGPKGDTGAAGAAGPDSVLHSAWIALNMTLQVNANNDSSYTQTISAPAITNNILDSGVVIAYIQNLFANDGSIVDVSDYGGGYLDVSYNLGTITITSFFGDLSTALFRYVVIPGSIVTNGIGGKIYTKAQLKAMTYSEVQKTFGLSSASSTTN